MGTRAEQSGSQEPARGTPSPVTTKRGRLGWRLLLLLLGLPPRLAALLLGCVRRLGSWRLPPPWPWRRRRKERERRVEPEEEEEEEVVVVLKKTGREPPRGQQEGGGAQVVNPAATPEPEPLEIGFNLVRHLFDAAVVSLLLVASPLARAALDALGLRGLLRLWLHGLALFLAASCGLALAAWLLRAYLAQLCLLFGAVQLLVLGVSLRQDRDRDPGPRDGGLEGRPWEDHRPRDGGLEEGHLAGLHSLASGISWERDNGLEDRRWERDNGLEDRRWERDNGLEDRRWERDNGLEDRRLERRPLEDRGLEDRLVQYVEVVGTTTTTTRGP